VEHPQSNGKVEVAIKVILKGFKSNFQHARESWVEEVPQVLWSYNTTPHSSTHESPFTLVYETNAMIPIEVAKPMFWEDAFEEERSDADRLVDLDTIGEVRGIT